MRICNSYPKATLVLATLALAMTVGCSTKREAVLFGSPAMGNTVTLDGLKQLAPPTYGKIGDSATAAGMRKMALNDIAMSLGAQSGLAFKAKMINLDLTNHAKSLDHVFDFNAILIGNNILPPVLQKGESTLNQDTDTTLRISDRMYKILKQAHFITAAPNWRDYLMMNFPVPDRPDDSVLPKTAQEKIVWAAAVERGWQQGLQQGDIIFSENLARLTEDYNGMLLYLQLLTQHMVSPPYVGKVELGVTGDGNEMHINDQVLRITAVPQLQVDPSQWRPILSHTDVNPQPIIDWKYVSEQKEKMNGWIRDLGPTAGSSVSGAASSKISSKVPAK